MVLIDKVPSVEARRNKWRQRLAKFLLGKVGPGTNTFLLPEQYWCGINYGTLWFFGRGDVARIGGAHGHSLVKGNVVWDGTANIQTKIFLS